MSPESLSEIIEFFYKKEGFFLSGMGRRTSNTNFFNLEASEENFFPNFFSIPGSEGITEK